jgi:hypothetical protein
LGGGFDMLFARLIVPVLANNAHRPLVGRKILPGPMIFREAGTDLSVSTQAPHTVRSTGSFAGDNEGNSGSQH